MSLELWRLLSLVAIGLWFVILVISKLAGITKNKYYHKFVHDEFIKKEKTANSVNNLYFTSGETQKYIKKYVVCTTHSDKFVLCNFNENYKYIKYYIMQYTKHGRVIEILKCVERNTEKTSRVVSIRPNTKYVNVVIGTVNDIELNSSVIRPLSNKRIALHSIIKSFLTFLFAFAARQLVIELVGGETYVRVILNDIFNYIAIAACVVLFVVTYFVSYSCLRMKNHKTLNGGVIEYEFL